jgi:hypothetical protein
MWLVWVTLSSLDPISHPTMFSLSHLLSDSFLPVGWPWGHQRAIYMNSEPVYKQNNSPIRSTTPLRQMSPNDHFHDRLSEFSPFRDTQILLRFDLDDTDYPILDSPVNALPIAPWSCLLEHRNPAAASESASGRDKHVFCLFITLHI